MSCDNLSWSLRHRDFKHFQHLRKSEQEAAIIRRASLIDSLPKLVSSAGDTRTVRILSNEELEEKEKSPARKVIFVEAPEEEEAKEAAGSNREHPVSHKQSRDCKRRRVLPPSELSASNISAPETPPQSPKFPDTPPLSPRVQEPREEEEEDLELISPYNDLEFVDSADEDQDPEEVAETVEKPVEGYICPISGVYLTGIVNPKKKSVTIDLFLSSDEEDEEEVVILN